MIPYGPITLKQGDLAYFDTFAGLLPCKVIELTGESGTPSTRQALKVKLTKTVGAYKRGEILESSGLHVVARRAVYASSGQYHIRMFLIEVS